MQTLAVWIYNAVWRFLSHEMWLRLGNCCAVSRNLVKLIYQSLNQSFNIPTTNSRLENSPHPPICEVIKFPTPRDDRGVKCPGNAPSGGMLNLRFYWYIKKSLLCFEQVDVFIANLLKLRQGRDLVLKRFPIKWFRWIIIINLLLI